MLRDGIALATLSEVGAQRGDGGLYSVVAVVAECRPVSWGRRRRDNRLVEQMDFFLSDDTQSLFKVRCWGEAALHAASRLRAHSVFLLDRIEAVSPSGERAERYGVWSSVHTSLHLLCSPPGPLLISPSRYRAVAKRVEDVLRVALASSK